MEAVIHFIWFELEETVKHWVEDVLSCVDQKMWYLRWEPTEKIDETQVDLQVVKTSFVMRMKNLQETLADTGNCCHKQIDLILQVEAQTMKAEIKSHARKDGNRDCGHPPRVPDTVESSQGKEQELV
jgi:hypothetical protein